MIFEYDINKSLLNKKKHGIDFEEAKVLFQDADAVIFPAKSCEEERFFVVGKICDKIYTAIITFREKNIRIISVRRSREKEKDQYLGLKNEENNGR